MMGDVPLTPRQVIVLACKARGLHRPEAVADAITLALAQEGIYFATVTAQNAVSRTASPSLTLTPAADERPRLHAVEEPT